MILTVSGVVESRRFLFTPAGTAGDLHPYLAVALELRERRHEVLFITHSLHRELIERFNFKFVAIGAPLTWNQVRCEKSVHQSGKAWKAALRWGAVDSMRDICSAIQERILPGRTVIASSVLNMGARIARDAFKIPLATLLLNPVFLRSAIQPPRTPGIYLRSWMPRWIAPATYWFGDKFVVDPLIGNDIRKIQRELGLKETHRFMHRWWYSPDLVLGLFFDFFVPRQEDWPCDIELVGHTLWDPPSTPNEAECIRDWLKSDQATICFVPGSVGPGDDDYYRIVSKACELVGCRGIILDNVDASCLSGLPTHMRHARYLRMNDVLPRCVAIVHSGSLGTLMQALACGTPQVVRPTVNDQFDNAHRLNRLGVAYEVRQHRFADRLVPALRKLLVDDAIHSRCRELAETIARRPSAVQLISDRLENVCLSLNDCSPSGRKV